MSKKRFKLIFIDEDDEWVLYDNIEEKYYDVDITNYEKEKRRILRNHHNLHEKYEKLNKKYEEYYYKYNMIKNNEKSAKRIYNNLKEVFE